MGTTPYRRLAAPCWGERGLRPSTHAPPNTTVRRAFSTTWLLGRAAGWDAELDSHVPRGHVPRGPGLRALRRQTGGWAKARDRLGRSPGLRAQERKKEEGRFAGETGSIRQRAGQGCAGVAGAGPKIEEASDGLQDSSMAQPRGETNQEY